MLPLILRDHNEALIGFLIKLEPPATSKYHIAGKIGAKQYSRRGNQVPVGNHHGPEKRFYLYGFRKKTIEQEFIVRREGVDPQMYIPDFILRSDTRYMSVGKRQR